MLRIKNFGFVSESVVTLGHPGSCGIWIFSVVMRDTQLAVIFGSESVVSSNKKL